MFRTAITFAAVLLLAACSLTSGRSNGFFGEPDEETAARSSTEPAFGEEVAPSEDAPPGIKTLIRVPFDLIEFEALVSELKDATDVRRQDIIDGIIAMGREAIPHVQRSAARAKSQSIRLDLLFIEESIRTLTTKKPKSTEREAAPTEGAPPENTPDESPAVSSIEAAAGEGSRPPTLVPDIQDIPEDLESGNFSNEEVDRMVASRLASAQRAFREGNRQRTIDICQAILTLVPNSRYRREVRQLLLDAKTGAQADRHLVGTIRFSETNYRFHADNNGTLARKAVFTVYLTNVGLRPLEIDLGADVEGRRSLLTLEVELREGEATNPLVVTGQIPVEMAAGKVVLQPNEHFSFTRELDSLRDLSPGQGEKYVMTRVNVAGSIRPASMHVLETEEQRTRVFRPILISGGAINVYPSAFPVEQATLDVASFVRAEIDAGRVQNLVLAAPMVEEKDVRKVVDLLLDKDLAVAPLAMRSARIGMAAALTGKDFKLDAEKWREWWLGNRLRYGPPR